MLSFSGRHYSKFTMCHLGIIPQCVRWYVPTHKLRNIEEMIKERRFEVDHATINRWVVDKHGKTVDFMLTSKRGRSAASRVFTQSYVTE